MHPRAAYCLIVAMLLLCLLHLGCGAPSQTCNTEYLINPATASVDHTAPFPANSANFMAVRRVTGPCAQPAVMPVGTWSTSDTTNTIIDANSGVATCLAPTSTPATIRFTSANSSEVFPTVTLTCR